MKKFSQFIKESNDMSIMPHDIDDFKYIAKYLDGKRAESYLKAIDAFWKAYNDKEIYNADYGDHYSYGLSRGLADAYDKVYYQYIEKMRETNEFGEHIYGVNNINKTWNWINKHKDLYPEIWTFVNSVKKLPEFCKIVKSYVIKGRKPKPVDPNAFVKPMVPYEAKKQALSFLNDAVDQIRSQYYAQMEQRIHKIKDGLVETVNEFDGNYRKISNALYKEMNSERIFLFQRIFQMDTSGPRTVNYFDRAVLSKDADKYIKKIAKDQVDNIINDFLGKNSEKLGHIFAKKAKVTEHKIVHNYVRNGVMENTMFFKFDDNTSFTIYTSTVYGYSNRGKFFVKFPTRFTNVMMKDGSKMGMPSEEKMIKEF